jgi:lipoprotein-anchoring transpeptidase ErfK/SrfK
MLSFRGLWGMMAGLVLLWGPVAIAQSWGSPNERPPAGAAPQPPGNSTVAKPLICDSSGKICVMIGKRREGPAAVAVSASSPGLRAPASSASVASVSPSRIAAPEFQPPKQQSSATTPRPLICDASGRICAPVSGQPTQESKSSRSPLPPATQAASASMTSSPIMPALAGPSPTVDASRPPVKKLSSLEHAAQIRIDGIGASDESAVLVTEDPFDWVLHAYKSQHRMEVYFKGHLYRTYHAVFGRNLAAGAKLWEGDRRTPEGNYLIVGKHRSARFGWFLHISYPNERDHKRFEQSRAAHLIPASANEGGQIGIHGTDSPYLNVSEVDWTTGCISVDNADIRELARLLPVGTLVIINP